MWRDCFAKRHIHLTPEDAEKFGVKDKEIVKVEINTDGRSLIFGDVVCRVSASYATAMHIDTDESNAALVVEKFTVKSLNKKKNGFRYNF